MQTTNAAQATADLLDSQLHAYGQRAGRRRRKTGAAEVLGYTAAAGGLAFAGGDVLGGVMHITEKFSVSFNAATATGVAAVAWDIDGAGGPDATFFAVSNGYVGRLAHVFDPPWRIGHFGARPFAAALGFGSEVYAPYRDFWSYAAFAVSGGPLGTGGGFLNTANYAGFNFWSPTSGPTFGWAKLRVDIAANPDRVVLTVCEWAYDETSFSITAGDRGTGSAVPCNSPFAPVPSPATPLLTLLGLGAMGVTAYRRRREAGLQRLADEQGATAEAD